MAEFGQDGIEFHAAEGTGGGGGGGGTAEIVVFKHEGMTVNDDTATPWSPELEGGFAEPSWASQTGADIDLAPGVYAFAVQVVWNDTPVSGAFGIRGSNDGSDPTLSNTFEATNVGEGKACLTYTKGVPIAHTTRVVLTQTSGDTMFPDVYVTITRIGTSAENVTA